MAMKDKLDELVRTLDDLIGVVDSLERRITALESGKTGGSVNSPGRS